MTTANKLRIFSVSLIAASMIGLGPIGYYWWQNHAAFAAASQTQQAAVPTKAVVLPTDPMVISGHPTSLSIPSLDMNLSVIDGTYDAKTGEWTLTNDKAQFATPSVEPNNVKGNTLIYGHYRREVFARLHTIQPDSLATITTDNGYVFTYKFTNTQTFDPADTSIFLYQGAPRLTIQTCSGAFYQNRQMFYFQLVDVKKAE